MKLAEKIFWWLAEKRGMEILRNPITGEDYMFRVYLTNPKVVKGLSGSYGQGKLCLNLIKNSDFEWEHRHTWDYFTLILSGGYTEHIYGKAYRRKPGWFTYRYHYQPHRLEVDSESPAVTLFFKTDMKVQNTSFIIDGKTTKDLFVWKRAGISNEMIRGSIRYIEPEDVSNYRR